MRSGAALRARDGVLDAVVSDPPNQGSVFAVLLATSTEAAPFRGRRAELTWLGRWWDDPHQPPLMVVTGQAGTGKTRLVTQFARGRPKPWVTGWLASGRGADVVAAIRACGDRALILVDNADQRADLAALLASLSTDRGAGPAMRVILISRGAGLASRLAATLDDRSRAMLDGVRELQLGPCGEPDDRARWFGEAVRAYARARQTPPPDLPARLTGSFTNPAEPILTLHAQALLAVLNSEDSRPMTARVDGLPFDRAAAALFAHEQHRWQTLAQRPEHGVTDLTSPVQEQAMAALLLASPADQAQAVAALRQVPELGEAPAERRANIARWAARLYPGDPAWPIQIKPDMLAEWFVVSQVTQTPELAGLVRVMTFAQRAALLVLLAHASDHISQAVPLFADVVAADTTHLAEAGVAAALTAFAGQRRLDGELASLIRQAGWSTDDLRRINARLTGRLPRTRVAVAEIRVKIARAGGDTADLADALHDLAHCLSDLGLDLEALAAGEEAVGLWRPLAQENPAYEPDLARSLMDLGVQLADLGRDREALAAGEDAVDLWRPLTLDNPGHQPSLAAALQELAHHLATLGRDVEALASDEEAVGLRRALAQKDPRYQFSLASALNNLMLRLARLGRYEEALASAEEAVDLWRPLAQENPAYESRFAVSLSNLGNRLSDLGRDREALAASEEAVGLLRPLAQDNPAYMPDLADSLSNLGIRLRAVGLDRKAALAMGEEAVGRLRPLAQENPAYKPRFAQCLNNLSTLLSDDDRQQEALAASEEAVGLWRPLAQENPAYEPDLARSLSNLGVRFGNLRRYQEGLAASEEAIGLWRPLTLENPAHHPSLAIALSDVATHLSAMGHQQEALAATTEAVRDWRALAQRNPGQYQETYNRELAQLRRTLQLQGQESESIWPHLDDRRDRGEPDDGATAPGAPEE
jgi:tetratricopeptide (TPR) repeat protein